MTKPNTDTTLVYVVDQQGATHVFLDESAAMGALWEEAINGAVHLTAARVQAPTSLTTDLDALAEWCAQNALVPNVTGTDQ